MKILSTKTNRANVVDVRRMVSGASNVITAKTIKFFANEKNGNLSPLASEVLTWAKENGFEMVSRPVGKSKLNNEYYEGKTQDVLWQWTSYTLK